MGNFGRFANFLAIFKFWFWVSICLNGLIIFGWGYFGFIINFLEGKTFFFWLFDLFNERKDLLIFFFYSCCLTKLAICLRTTGVNLTSCELWKWFFTGLTYLCETYEQVRISGWYCLVGINRGSLVCLFGMRDCLFGMRDCLFGIRESLFLIGVVCGIFGGFMFFDFILSEYIFDFIFFSAHDIE